MRYERHYNEPIWRVPKWALGEPVTNADSATVERNKPGSHYRNPRGVGFYDWPAPDPIKPAEVPTEPIRTGNYIRTANGRKFWPHDPRVEDIFINDIAHSLSRINRYGGHIKQERYSVAEHCVLGTRWMRQAGWSDEIAFMFLMHDAPEFGGIGDVGSPAKKDMPEYRGVEWRIWRAVAVRYDLPTVLPAIVHEVDGRITTDEMIQCMWGAEPNAPEPLGVTLQFWSADRAKREFLALFEELYGEE